MPKTTLPVGTAGRAADAIAAASGHPMPLGLIGSLVRHYVWTPWTARHYKRLFNRPLGVFDGSEVQASSNLHDAATWFNHISADDPIAISFVIRLGSLPHSGLIPLNKLLLGGTLARFEPQYRLFIRDPASHPRTLLELGCSLAYLVRFVSQGLDDITRADFVSLLREIEVRIGSDTFVPEAIDLIRRDGEHMSVVELRALICRFRHRATGSLYRIGLNRNETVSAEEALSIGAYDVAIYSFLLKLMQHGSSGSPEYDHSELERLSNYYLQVFHKHLDADQVKISSLYGSPVESADFNPKTCLGAVYVARAGIFVKQATLSTGRTKKRLLKLAASDLIYSEQLYASVRPPWLHGIANLYAVGAVNEFYREDFARSLFYATMSRLNYETTDDVFRLKIIKAAIGLIETRDVRVMDSFLEEILFRD